MDLVAGADHIAVPVIVLGEYRLGIAQSRPRASYESCLRQWIETVTVLDIDDATTHSYSDIGLELKNKGKPIATNDLWIAALCRQHSLPLVSRDKHFDLVPNPGASTGNRHPSLQSAFHTNKKPAPVKGRALVRLIAAL